MSDLDGSESPPRGGRATPLWVGAVVLVAAATGILILSDDARLLRLGLVAALWAALIAAFAVAKLRGRITEDEDRAADLQEVYELELEREVAARREFELEAENEARRQVAEEHHNEVQALRAELSNLRQSLEQMLGGDVLFERVALRAESTRVRSLTEQSGATGNGRAALRSGDGWGRELPAGYQGHIDTGSWPAGRPGAVDSGSHPVTPHSAQSHPGQSYPAQSYPAESYPAQSYPAQSYPAQSYPGQEYPVRPDVDQNSAFQNPGPTYPASGHPVPDHPVPARSGRPHSGPDNSRTVNGRLADDDAQPNPEMMARLAGEQPPVNQSPPNQSQPDPSPMDAPAGQTPAGQHPGDQHPGDQPPGGQPPAERQHGTVPRSKPQQSRGRSASAKATPPSTRAEPPPPGSAPKKRTPKPFLKSSSRTGTDSPRETTPADAGSEKSETQADVPTEQGSPQVVDGAHSEGTSVTELLAAYGNSGESQGRRRRHG